MSCLSRHSNNARSRRCAVALAAASIAACSGLAAPVAAQAPVGTVEPVYRVARDASNAAAQSAPQQQPTEIASRIVPPAAAQSPFDLAQRPGEHPLMPALRVAKEALAAIDQNIHDYQAILYKQERINGELQDQEVAFVKIRHQPFSVHMFFLAPNKGRECMYVAGPNGEKGNLLARDCGWRKKFGVVSLDPEGSMAMKGQKYPITKLGIRSLTSELIQVASNDINYRECEVTTKQTEIGPANGAKRAVTVIEAVHPNPRANFRFHKAEVFIDNELRVPIRYAAYLWPEHPGEAPPLEESYTYLNLKLNNGFTDSDFSKENPENFKN